MLLRAAGSPMVVGPFMIGATALAACWALGLGLGIGLFGGLAGVLGAAGSLVTRLTLKGEAWAKEFTEEAIRREQEGRQQTLDTLDRRLTEADDDPRPEEALRDLRSLVKAFDEAESTAGKMHLPTLVEIRAGVNELFDHCVKSLEQTDRLWEMAKQLRTPDARKALLDRRESILEDVNTTIRQLSRTLVGVQNLGAHEGSPRELERLRGELDRSLEIAKTVEERVRSLVDDSGLAHYDKPPTTTPQEKA